MSTDFVVRPASAAQFQTAIDWAAAEGWNPGLDDLAAFHAADPEGFLVGYLGDEPVSSISVVRYGDAFGFLGFYIVREPHRGKGFGLATWNAGLAHLAGRTIGLDGVVAQQDNYRKSGFGYAGRNIRFTAPARAFPRQRGPGIRPIGPSDTEPLMRYDRRFFPADRTIFLKAWTLPPEGTRRKTLVAQGGGRLTGYGTIRPCVEGYKIGPLFADSGEIAQALLAALTETAEPGAPVFLDVPADNPTALRLAEQFNMAPVFETARMYKGPAPATDMAGIFGITTFELG
ncbi:GNAT family N-acetyltransferase [Pelagibacterium xiamenense]|uniref:GNAT family N-acetyltransferase n=1 Tax=Pelagibacterium xiamenense TaxID=2901140 RepID=UPI001E463B3A|nr:GNAT family N-acetyltransferase [Pelagibacterium xiamenense]MCD7059734.1 GNAT family N-acetyltransferase [Pelagibacterium xiamenense]